jgi:hypothetical protein
MTLLDDLNLELDLSKKKITNHGYSHGAGAVLLW